MQNKVSVQNSSELAELAPSKSSSSASDWDKLFALSDACVACGLCAPVCPSYAIEATEAQSPRGRVQLIKALAQARLVADYSVQDALNGCVGCARCESVCPANVQVLTLVDGVRGKITPKRSWRGDLIGAVLSRPALTRGLQNFAGMGLQTITRHLGFPVVAAATTTVAQSTIEQSDVVFSAGCANNLVQPALLNACMRVASALSIPARIEQACCGGFARHRGQMKKANQMGAEFADKFAGSGTIVGLTPGCHREQKQLLGTRYLDLIEWLMQIGFGDSKRLFFRDGDKGDALRIVVHQPCSVRMQDQAVANWLTLLAKIEGLEYLELDSSITCCGAGGAYRFDQANRSAKMAAITSQAIQKFAPDLVLSANVGCLAQLQAHLNLDREPGKTLEVLHPLVFLNRYLTV